MCVCACRSPLACLVSFSVFTLLYFRLSSNAKSVKLSTTARRLQRSRRPKLGLLQVAGRLAAAAAALIKSLTPEPSEQLCPLSSQAISNLPFLVKIIWLCLSGATVDTVANKISIMRVANQLPVARACPRDSELANRFPPNYPTVD